MDEASVTEFKKRFMVDGKIRTIPKKESFRLAMRRILSSEFKADSVYSEDDVNRVLARHYDDYVYLRRDFVDHGVLGRTDRGDTYVLLTDSVEK